MPINVSNFLAGKYLFIQNKNSFLRTATKLTFLGIVVASCALTLTLMITSGFENSIKATLQGLSSDITIFPNRAAINDAFLEKLKNDVKIGILSGYCPTSINQLIIEQNGNYQTIIFQGVIPRNYAGVTTITSKLSMPFKKRIVNLEDLMQGNQVILGEKLAANLNLIEKSEFSVFIPTIKNHKVSLKEKKVVLAATINTGFDEYDKNMIIGSQDLYSKLFGQSKTYDFIMIKVNPKITVHPFALNKTRYLLEKTASMLPINIIDPIATARDRLKTYYSEHKIYHWKELSPNLMASMQLEKLVINMVILLIMLVGLINIISLIYMKIQTKRRDIAILLTLGLTTHEIKSIFVKMGLLISIGGTIFGELLAYAAGSVISKYEIIKLPDVYYIQTIPINMSLSIFISVFIFTNIIAYIASRIPASAVTNMNIAQVLRN